MFRKMKGLSAALAFFVTTSASAITVWMPTDGNMNVITNTNYGAQGIEFGIFDDSNMALDDGLGYLPFYHFDKIVVTPDVGGDWLFTNSNGDSLLLSDSNKFLIAANDGSGWSGDTDFIQLGPSGAYDIEFFNGPVMLRMVDLTTVVPVPASVWLFGAGLIGLASISRRRRFNP